MSEYNEIVKLAVDTWHGKTEKYSKGESLDVLRKALIEANNGSTKIDYRAIRDGKCNGVFAIVEEILKVTVAEGLQGDEFFNGLVDFRNLPLGDKNEFEVEDKTLFVVSEAATVLRVSADRDCPVLPRFPSKLPRRLLRSTRSLTEFSPVSLISISSLPRSASLSSRRFLMIFILFGALRPQMSLAARITMLPAVLIPKPLFST